MPVDRFHPAPLSALAPARLRDIGPRPELPDACDLGLECPITVELFADPVISRDDGHTYEREKFRTWVMGSANPTSPLTRAPLKLASAWKLSPRTAPDYVVPNVAMRARVNAFRDETETFAARLASWEEARAQLEEDAALLAAIHVSTADLRAASQPSAPPFELMSSSGTGPHPWLLADAAPFGPLARAESKQKQTADEYAKRGENAYRVSNVQEALRWMTKATQRAPQDTPKLLRLTRLLCQEARTQEALQWLHSGVRAQPQDAERNHEFGQLLLAQASVHPTVGLEDAQFFLQQALSLHRAHHDASRPHSCMQLARLCAALGDCHARLGHREQSHALFKEAEANHPGYGPYVQRLGCSYLRKAQHLGVTHTDSPELREALRFLGRAQPMLQTECEAQRNRNHASLRALAACWHSFGDAHLLHGDDTAAVDNYRAAIALHRGEGTYHGSLGDALRNVGDLAGARSAYFKAAELDPKCGRYEYELSCIAYARQEWTLALQAAEVAAKKDPGNALFTSQVATLRDASASRERLR